MKYNNTAICLRLHKDLLAKVDAIATVDLSRSDILRKIIKEYFDEKFAETL